MTDITKLLTTKQPFLTDGGFETWLFFQEGFEAPEFAAIVLMQQPDARQAMRRYFDTFLGMAAAANTGFVLDTNTWRGCTGWGAKLDKSEQEMISLSEIAVNFAMEIRDAWRSKVSPIILNGVVGPAGDGYAPEDIPNASTARELHGPQIGALANAGVDLISALTMTNVGEAIGIALESAAAGVPSVISFTVETDGRLPTGDALKDAIEAVDAATNGAPLYYMVNCAHPDHFEKVITTESKWVDRLGGIRANASRMSHAELDVAETLDDGNPDEFGRLYAELHQFLPHLRVVGGCCGTDHRHVGCVSSHMHTRKVA